MTNETNSRTEYKREWRHTHPESIRTSKRKAYWKDPEKSRKLARDRYYKIKERLEN